MMEELKRVLIHIRWPLQVYTLLGFLFGIVIAKIRPDFYVAFAFISWFLLWAGVTLFNSYYDKDEKPVAGLKNPPKVTKSLLYGSIILKLSALVLAIFINQIFLLLSSFVIFLSLLYSHKAFRLKSHGFVALFFNFIAGAVTFLAATSLGKSLMGYNILYGCVSAGLFLTSIHLMMQVHQIKDDKERGDISYAAMFGKDVTLTTSILIMIISGLSGLFAMYISSLILQLIVLAIYMIIGSLFAVQWKIKRKPDFDTMTKITNYFSFGGSIILLIFIFFT